MSSHKRMTTWQKATALVPLALLSGAWTTSLAVTSAASADGPRRHGSPTAPPSRPGHRGPRERLRARVRSPRACRPAPRTRSSPAPPPTASPSAALAAYQRAAQVIDAADPSCNIEWPLVAAIGRVESDHGRYGGNTLDSEGVSRPGIYGIPLDGSNGTQRITDTDAGQYDNDKSFDRAVGPMQFIPSTWSVVGVDGDGDGKRNPQDIDDAALGDRRLPLLRRRGPLDHRGPGVRGLPLQPQPRLRRPGARRSCGPTPPATTAPCPTSSAGHHHVHPDYGDSVLASGTTGYHYPQAPGAAAAAGSAGGSLDGGTGATAPSTSAAPPASPRRRRLRRRPAGRQRRRRLRPGRPDRHPSGRRPSDADPGSTPVVDDDRLDAEAMSFCTAHLPA